MPVLERVQPEESLRRVQEVLGDRVTDARLNYGHVDIVVTPENLVEVMTALKDTDGIRCRFFTFLSAIDRSEYGGAERAEQRKQDPSAYGLEVLVHVYSPEFAIHVNVHVPVDFDDPVCPSISDVYGGAQWHERECFEMFGVDFTGHPRLVKLYLPEDFEGHPLRKAFRLPSRFLKEWPGAKDPEEAAARGR